MIYIVASLASISSRIDSLSSTVDSIIKQVDKLHIYLNNYTYVPKFLEHEKIIIYRSQNYRDLADIGKFYPLFINNMNCYFFSIDDDIIYPPNYVKRMLDKYKSYHEECVITIHGNNIPNIRLESYYNQKKCIHYIRNLGQDTKVDIAGTGTVLFKSSLLPTSINDFPQPLMADIWFYNLTKKYNIDVYAIARPKGWLQAFKNVTVRKDAISFDFKEIDKQVTKTLNKIHGFE